MACIIQFLQDWRYIFRGLWQATFPELQDQPLSPDWQVSGGFPHQVRIDENANEVIEIRAGGLCRRLKRKELSPARAAADAAVHLETSKS